MKVKIFKYKISGKIYVDQYLENEKIEEDYSDCEGECFDIEINQDDISKKASEFINDYKYFKKLLFDNLELMDNLTEYAHNIFTCETEVGRKAFIKSVKKEAEKDALNDILEDIGIQIENGTYEKSNESGSD